jgi:hypothetical protein
MKYILAIVVLILMFKMCSSCGDKPSNQDLKVELNSKPTPVYKVVDSDLGRIKQNRDGESVGKINEYKEMKRLMANDTADVYEVHWVWDCSPKYGDMPVKLVYHKVDSTLRITFKQTYHYEEYKQVSTECMQEFLKAKPKDIYKIQVCVMG